MKLSDLSDLSDLFIVSLGSRKDILGSFFSMLSLKENIVEVLSLFSFYFI